MYHDASHGFKQESFIAWLVKKGDCSRVYSLSEKHVVKVPTFAEYPLDNEYEIQRNLFCEGISVPKPEGIFMVNLRTMRNVLGIEERGWKDGLVMQRVHGVNGLRVYKRIEDRVLEEISKAEKKGFVPVDTSPANFLYDRKNDKVYLIDFGFWRRNVVQHFV